MDPIYQYWLERSFLEGTPHRTYIDEDYHPAEHDTLVLELINFYIDHYSSPTNSIAGNLGLAVKAIVKDRESSEDLVYMPDASYYLQARQCISEESSPAMQIIDSQGGIVLTYFYNMLKIGFNPTNYLLGTHILQSTAGVPNSPPSMSSILWVKRGAYDGFNDEGEQLGKPLVHPSWPHDFAFGL